MYKSPDIPTILITVNASNDTDTYACSSMCTRWELGARVHINCMTRDCTWLEIFVIYWNFHCPRTGDWTTINTRPRRANGIALLELSTVSFFNVNIERYKSYYFAIVNSFTRRSLARALVFNSLNFEIFTKGESRDETIRDTSPTSRSLFRWNRAQSPHFFSLWHKMMPWSKCNLSIEQ